MSVLLQPRAVRIAIFDQMCRCWRLGARDVASFDRVSYEIAGSARDWQNVAVANEIAVGAAIGRQKAADGYEIALSRLADQRSWLTNVPGWRTWPGGGSWHGGGAGDSGVCAAYQRVRACSLVSGSQPVPRC